MRRKMAVLMGVVLGLALFSFPVHGQDLECDYVLSLAVSAKGIDVEDGYNLWAVLDSGYLDICGVFNGATTDIIYAEFSDDFDVYWDIYGTVIWNRAGTRAYIQGSDLTEDLSSYLDGTIRWSRGLYRISAAGGVNDGNSFILRYSSILGYGYLDLWEVLKASELEGSRTPRFQRLDQAKLKKWKERVSSKQGGNEGGAK